MKKSLIILCMLIAACSKKDSMEKYEFANLSGVDILTRTIHLIKDSAYTYDYAYEDTPGQGSSAYTNYGYSGTIRFNSDTTITESIFLNDSNVKLDDAGFPHYTISSQKQQVTYKYTILNTNPVILTMLSKFDTLTFAHFLSNDTITLSLTNGGYNKAIVQVGWFTNSLLPSPVRKYFIKINNPW